MGVRFVSLGAGDGIVAIARSAEDEAVDDADTPDETDGTNETDTETFPAPAGEAPDPEDEG